MLPLRTPDDLQRLIKDEVQESISLDYKDSRALAKDKKGEICKDVSAFANSAGGQLVYGVTEDKHVPTGVDEGAEPSITKEWIEQVIDSNIQPRIEGLIIHPIPLAKGLGFVIDIPQATTRAPHQAPDNRYYKRQNFQSAAMEDYEVKDAMRRATTPDLFVSLSFLGGARQFELEFGTQETSTPFNLIAHVENRASQPAYHVVVDIGVDMEFVRIADGDFERLPDAPDSREITMKWYRWSLASPPGLPIFKEHKRLLTNNMLMLALNVRSIGRQNILDLTIRTYAPGFSSTEHWAIVSQGPRIRIESPTSRFVTD
jgi:hypothetical protein